MSSPHVPAPVGASTASAAGRARWLPVVLTVVGIACLAAVAPVFRHGIVTHPFPSYVQNDPSYEVARYSAPWIGGALALGGIGLLCLLIAGGRLLTRRAPAATVSRPADVSHPAGLDPRPTEAAREY